MNKRLMSLLVVVTAFGCTTIKSEEQTKVTRKDSADIKNTPFLNRLFSGKKKATNDQTQQPGTSSVKN